MFVRKEIRMAILFDSFGNPVPAGIISVSLSEVEALFVTAFPQSTRRKEIWDGFWVYNRDLSAVLLTEWEQWLGGSFITLKPDPNDIDVVNFIFEDLSLVSDETLYPFSYPDSLERYSVDAYFVRVYQPKDPRHRVMMKEYDYWIWRFGQDRENRPKAILSLKDNIC